MPTPGPTCPQTSQQLPLPQSLPRSFAQLATGIHHSVLVLFLFQQFFNDPDVTTKLAMPSPRHICSSLCKSCKVLRFNDPFLYGFHPLFLLCVEEKLVQRQSSGRVLDGHRHVKPSCQGAFSVAGQGVPKVLVCGGTGPSCSPTRLLCVSEMQPAVTLVLP